VNPFVDTADLQLEGFVDPSRMAVVDKKGSAAEKYSTDNFDVEADKD
jgi:hypothetical protein